ncbi:hypothetical protein NBRC116601_04330 [Cognatishimia sp. WU-CL00825]|uniref:hypothetical protein n=1 Tax=Cognatishimia sp. WU-CL00825 TaxID=3127658 RepID=UPI0031066B75
MTQEVVATVRISAPRRWMAVFMQALLGALVIYVAFDTPPALPGQVFLLVLGGAALWLAQRTYFATSGYIELTREGLWDSRGMPIVALSEITKVERGTFALKPSSGFTLHLKNKAPGQWMPGLWWRWRRRVGIGGTASGADTKSMAQIIEALMQEQNP